MLVDDIGDVTITNDGATILKLLEVEQPAAKVRLLPAAQAATSPEAIRVCDGHIPLA
jgi:chaperonin GroEL (HSP60 family)